ncbi:threonyl-tRNA synthetase [Limnochorda pilosa]|uniref:Threonine--tRNA ligase n=1 Tax=Limnochorda pilosa TaxID=1555112 RepID=A0A0K2SMV7_LIMPI|nr:threonyl-tRNA synthetase [Limnochorda pilosa]
MELSITLADGSVRRYPAGVTPRQVAEELGEQAGQVICARFEGELVDLDRPLEASGRLELVDPDSDDGLEVLRHSTAHLMAQALKRLHPDAQLAIGPPVENGFYYDVDLDRSLTPEDLAHIEEEMRRVVAEDLPIEREVLPAGEARRLFQERGEGYKLEILDEIQDPTVSVYRQGEFVDLCRGPHVPSTGRHRAFKLLNVAGAYWRGDASNKQLQRLYGTAFPRQEQLEAYLKLLEEAERRDHRRLGRELDLFSLHEEGPGFPFLHPKGMVIRNELETFWREEHVRRGYQEIRTPIILSQELWLRSGHWDHYRENMYFTQIDERPFAVKPMNCPGHILLYREGVKSYRDLPLRYCELGLVHRHELSGVLHGLLRVRAFTQDDAHLFVRPDQIQQEVEGVLDLMDRIYSVFGFSYQVELSTRPENSIGTDAMWEQATRALAGALEAQGRPYKVNEGDGAFYGPKIDFHLRDSIGRTWQCGTVQVDFAMPERFELEYVGSDGSRHRPVMVHRAIYGSLERFMGILIEHFAGAFPLWLAPVQAVVLPVAGAHAAYARQVRDQLREAGLRAELDDREEKLGYRIRQAEVRKVPYMLVTGGREAESGQVAVRRRGEHEQHSEPVESLIARLREEAAARR